MTSSKRTKKSTEPLKSSKRKSRFSKDLSHKNYSSRTTWKTSTWWRSNNTRGIRPKCLIRTPDRLLSIARQTSSSYPVSSQISMKRVPFVLMTPRLTRQISRNLWSRITYCLIRTIAITQTLLPNPYHDRLTIVSTLSTGRCPMSS